MKNVLSSLIFLLLLMGCSQLPAKRTDKLSILQGVTNGKEVEFSIVALKGRELKFELRTADGEVVRPEVAHIISRKDSSFVVHKLLFLRDPLTIYNLFVFEGAKLVDQRLVRRGPQISSKLRLAVASSMNDYYSQNFKIWDELARTNPEYLLLIGDNVYADQSNTTDMSGVDPKNLWKRYVDVRLSLPLFFQQKLIPAHGLWDDHDFGLTQGGREYRHKEASREIFETFFAQSLAEDNWSRGHGIGGLLSLGDFNLYFLDGRSFRTQNVEGSHLGIDQYSWLMGKLKEESTPGLLIKGDQFFGGHHRLESYEGSHPREFAQFTSDLRKLAAPINFISGNRHLSEVMHFPRGIFGRPSYELTSSPMHAQTFEEVDENPWRVVMANRPNFLLIDNLAKGDHWFLDVQSVGENGEVYFRRELAVYIKDLQDNLREVRKRRSGKRRYYRKSRGRR